MRLLHSSIEEIYIVQMQHCLIFVTPADKSWEEIQFRRPSPPPLGSACYGGDTLLLPVSSPLNTEASASPKTEGPLLLPGLDVITAAPLPPIGAAVFLCPERMRVKRALSALTH